jgi:UDP-N-acetylglucosamine 2-epimerase (non-hydrolysing)
MKKRTINLIAAARPNFMKIAPLYHALAKETWCRPVIIHTGQHYDANMSDTFFNDLDLPDPDLHLGVGSGTHAEMTAGVMIKYEKICIDQRPDITLVVGDVNSTMACAISSKKLCIPVMHLEAGLRSRDRTMPEEINRIITDSISDLLLTPSADADANLINEGIPENSIVMVGNIMIDSYCMLKEKIEKRNSLNEYNLQKKQYAVITLHRPSNVDDSAVLTSLVDLLLEIGRKIKVIFPVHPRTKEKMISFNLWNRVYNTPGITLTDPLGYISFMSLVRDSRLIITDSGGIQEETTYLGIPCLTIRDTTERPITITQGTNRLVSTENIISHVKSVMDGLSPQSKCPDLWDGCTAGRVVKAIRKFLQL